MYVEYFCIINITNAILSTNFKVKEKLYSESFLSPARTSTIIWGAIIDNCHVIIKEITNDDNS